MPEIQQVPGGEPSRLEVFGKDAGYSPGIFVDVVRDQRDAQTREVVELGNRADGPALNRS